MLHPDGRFATVSYLGADGVILKGKPESGSDFTVSPQLETDFVCIQTLLCGDHPVDSSIHGISDPVTCQPIVQLMAYRVRGGVIG